jgi:hypothetical protein
MPPVQIKKNEVGGACRIYGGEEGACRVLARKPEGKRPLRNPATDCRVVLKLISKKWNGGVGGQELD